MGEYGWGWGMGFGFLFMLLLFVLAVLALVALLRWLFGAQDGSAVHDRARQILNERYARGAIDREQYEQMKQDLESEKR